MLDERNVDTTDRCFICGIEKNVFNRAIDRDAFKAHITHDQNLWNYVYFIIYIWGQDKDDDDGLETYVRKCIDAKDLTWFPMNKALRLAEHRDEGNTGGIRNIFKKDLGALQENIKSKLSLFKEDISRSIGRVENAMNAESETLLQPSRRLRKDSSLSGGYSSAGGPGTGNVTARTQLSMSTERSIISAAAKVADMISTEKPPFSQTAESSITIKIASIRGLYLDASMLQRVSCRVSCATGEFIVQPYELQQLGDGSLAGSDEDEEDRSAVIAFDWKHAPGIVVLPQGTTKQGNSVIRIQVVLSNEPKQGLHDLQEGFEDIALHIGTAYILIEKLMDAADDEESYEADFQYAVPNSSGGRSVAKIHLLVQSRK